MPDALDEYRRLAAEGATVIPVVRPLLADALTPVLAWSTVGGGPGSYLLESVEHGEKWGRFSFVGYRPALIARGRPGRFEILEDGAPPRGIDCDDPWGALRALLADWRPPKDIPSELPRFWGGAVGYVAYDAVRGFEPKVGPPLQDDDAWDFSFAVGGTLLIFDGLRQRALMVSARQVGDDPDASYAAAVRELDALAEELSRPRVPRLLEPPGIALDTPLPASSMTREEFRGAVETSKEHIRAGDIFQVVVSQRFVTKSDGVDLFDVYRMLRAINPSPYMYMVRMPGVGIAGASPETLVRVEGGVAQVRPIAGTRPRGADDEEDARVAEELLADPKERAEHVMLVDLGRNDLGRVCRAGTVRLTQEMAIERYSHVMHIVSNVVGEVREGQDALDVLRATFPAGTLSGAPKVRAMQILDGLEPEPRGVYGGAVGYVGFDGNLDVAIAIRTVVEVGGELRVQAGAGLVEASDPDSEYDETVNKARAALAAIEAARRR